jgi:uncharacterized protein YdeI (YjbR/CyaY-like superfamily)
MSMAFEDAVPVSGPEEFSKWLSQNGESERERWLMIFKKSTGRQTVTFDQLLEVALSDGWADVQTKGIDEERYAIRFVPRKAGSNWSATNRAIAKRLLADGKVTRRGKALLPSDL